MLASIAADLRSRYPTTEGIRVDTPGVRLPFGIDEFELAEVIPAYDVTVNALGFADYVIPNGYGGWLKSSPEANRVLIQQRDDQLGGKLKPLVRFLKAWKYYRSVPISSFYVEIATLSYSMGETTIVYDIDLKRMFEYLWGISLLPFANPRFPDQQIVGCKTDVMHREAIEKLAGARAWSTQAVELRDRDPRKAVEAWTRVFGNQFPSYG